MKFYRYLCIDEHERRCEGTLRAISSESAQRELSSRGWTLVSLGQEKFADDRAKDAINSTSLTLEQRSRFFLKFSLLFRAGLPIVEAIEIAGHAEMDQPDWTDLVAARVAQGYPLSRALEVQNIGFSPSTIALLKMGEESGQLVDVLDRLAKTSLERMDQIRELKAKLTYPVVQFIVLAGLCLLLGMFMGPQLNSMVGELGGAEPTLTRWVTFALSPPVIGTLFVGAFLVTVFLILTWSTPAGRYFRERILKSTPVLSKIHHDLVLASFCRSLGSLLDYGFGWSQSLTLSRTGSEDFDRDIESFREGLLNSDLVEAVENATFFPDLMKAFLQVGFESQKVPKFMILYAKMLEDSGRRRLDLLLSLMEPAMLIGLGSLVGLIVVSSFLPIMSLVSQF